MHGRNGGKLPEQGMPIVAKSSAEQLGYMPVEIFTALLQVHFRDCGLIKLQWQPLTGSRCRVLPFFGTWQAQTSPSVSYHSEEDSQGPP